MAPIKRKWKQNVEDENGEEKVVVMESLRGFTLTYVGDVTQTSGEEQLYEWTSSNLS